MAENDNRRVDEMMIPLSEYPYVYDDDTLKDAIGVLKKHRMGQDRLHRSLLVFSRTEKVQGEERLVGILTIRDVFNALQKNKILSENEEVLAMGWAYFYQKDPLMENLIIKVSSAIRPLVKAYVQADDPIDKAIKALMTQKVNIIPVFSNKKVVGIIRAIDILDYISDMLTSDDLPEVPTKKGRQTRETPPERSAENTGPAFSSLTIPLFGA